MDLLNDDEAKNLSAATRTVKETAYLTLDVYPMRIYSWERKFDKNESPYLRVNIDTGYKTQKGEPRFLMQMFYLSGEYPDGRKKIDDLARFLKMCFKLKEVSNDNLKLTVNRTIAVATKKDSEGYIQFWYADHLDNIKEMKVRYKPKQEHAKVSGDATEKIEKIIQNSTEHGDDDMPEWLREEDNKVSQQVINDLMADTENDKPF